MKRNEAIKQQQAKHTTTMQQARERMAHAVATAEATRKVNAERKQAKPERTTTEAAETTTTEYPLITMDDALKVARASAYVAIKRAYFATYRTIKDSDGEIINYDGNVGGAEKIRSLFFGFSHTANAKRDKMEQQESAYYDTLAETDTLFSEFIRKKNALVESALKKQETATGKDERKAIKEELEKAIFTLECEYADVITKRRKSLENFMDAVDTYAENNANDTDDCISEACTSLIENIKANGGTVGTENAFIESVRAVHRWLYNQEKNVCVKIRTTTDKEGNILSVGEYRYIKYPHIYIEQYGTDEQGNRVLDFIDVNNEINKMVRGAVARDSVKELFAHLTEAERRLCIMLSKDYTYETMARQILGEIKADKKNKVAEEKRRQAKIRKRVERLRKKCKELCPEVYAEYLEALDREESGAVIDWTKMV